jgi:hypothetical protein
LLHVINLIAKGDIAEHAILDISQHLLGKAVAAKADGDVTPLFLPVYPGPLYNAHNLVRVMVEEEGSGVVQTAEVSCATVMAQHFIAEITSYRELAREGEVDSALVVTDCKVSGLSTL